MIALSPMTDDEYQPYVRQSIQDYAAEHVRGGRWSAEDALEQSAREFDSLLTQGLHTPDHFLYMIVEEDTGQRVGVLWFALQSRAGQRTAWVYDIVIYEEFRRHGYATQAFRLLEERASEQGATSIALHVFGHNHSARALYEKLGYEPTNIQMVKHLAPQG